MDPEMESEVVKKCFKHEHQLYDNLNIIYNAATFMIVLWNKFQIFVYEDRNLENAARIFNPEFQIHDLILSDNYILCLDSNGNIHNISLKFKNKAQKRLKSSFQPREQNITAIFHIQDHALSIKHDVHNIFLCMHKITTDFLFEKKVELKYANPWPLPEPELGKCLLTAYKISEQNFDVINKIYKVNYMPKDCNVVAVSFDKITIFSCLFSPRMVEEEVSLIKLHTCPTEICKFEIMNDLTLIVCLKAGTVLRFYLTDILKEYDVVHMNIAIHKYLILNETCLYTDGASMWRSDKTFSEDITMRQFVIKHVKDFVRCGDQVICTTYSNLIYNIAFDDESSYLKTSDYCETSKLLNNSEYLYKVLEEVERNNHMLKKVREEGNFITVLALSNRQDIMDTVIVQNIIIYENYEDVIRDHSDLLLTDNMSDYFEKESVLFVVKLSTKALIPTINNILANLFNDLQIHISFFTKNKLIKTTSMKLRQTLKKIGLLTSLNIKNINMYEVDVIIKLLASIPGCHDREQPLWSCLYEKHVALKSEHFIQLNTASTNVTHLKDSEDSIENLIYKNINNYHSHIFQFKDISTLNLNLRDWSMYLKLPANYMSLLTDNRSTRDSFNAKKAEFLLQQYTDKEFLECKSELSFEIGKEKCKIRITNDFSEPLLRVTSKNIIIAYNIRNFFSRLIYNDFRSHNSTSQEYVKYSLYNLCENLQKDLKSYVEEFYSLDDFKNIAEHFESSVVGAIPI